MFHSGNIQGIAKYILLSALTLSSDCFAAVNRVQNGDSHEDQLLKSASRSLLYSWDDDDSRPKFGNSYSSSEQVFYIMAIVFISIIVLICKCCIKYGCSEGEDNRYSNAVLHPPPRNLEPPPSNFDFSAYSSTRGSVLAPPTTSSRSIILPYEAEVFPAHLTGFDNPNYHSENTSSRQFVSQPIPFPAQMGDVLDMPPSYDTVIKEGIKYPGTTTKD